MGKFLALFFGFFIVFLMAVNVSAQSPNADIPERNGDYPDPEHANLRVRVFVHESPRARPDQEVLAVCSADGLSEAVVGATSWKLPNTDWKYKINSSSVPSSVGGSNLGIIASTSFNTWTNSISTSSRPSLVFNGQTAKTRKAFDGENIITWGRTSGSALGVTYVWYYTATKLVAEVDTVMNKKFLWSLNTCSANSYDAENILIHELGHWFGLDDEYTTDYVENSMFGYGSKAERKKITPTNGDKAGLNVIYN